MFVWGSVGTEDRRNISKVFWRKLGRKAGLWILEIRVNHSTNLANGKHLGLSNFVESMF